jgi:DNA-binding NarL/FixJ family response regulator
MKFVIVDDHPVFRIGLAACLREVFGPETDVVEADGWDAVLAGGDACRGADVVFCDLHMPGRESSEGLTAVVAAIAPTPVLVVSASDQPADVRRAFACGARGYVAKRKTLRVLKSAVEIVLAGDVFAPADILIGPDDGPAERAEPQPAPAAGGGRALSQRQRQILELLAEGLSNKEIAIRLDIVEGTVKVQLKAIYRKLGVANRTQAALHLRGETLDRPPAASAA